MRHPSARLHSLRAGSSELVPFPILLSLETAYGENSLIRSGAGESVGILRLRMRIHKANPHAPLRMAGLRGLWFSRNGNWGDLST